MVFPLANKIFYNNEIGYFLFIMEDVCQNDNDNYGNLIRANKSELNQS